MDNSAVIKCEKISKRYEGKDILKNVSLTCKRGEAIALVGANGCGKSTLLRILAGVTRPSSGEVIYAHSNIKMSFIPDHFEKLDIPAGKLLKYMLEGFDFKDADTKMKRLCEQFRIDKLLDVPLKHLSKGSLQKIATIQALICENDLVLMDEPLSGQDMMSKLCFIQEVLDRKKAGMSIIMACHEKEIIEEIADRVLLLEEGMLSDGYDYIYQSGSGKGAFLLELKEEDFEEMFGDVETLSVSEIGNKCRIIIKREDSQRVFGICLDHKIRIIRYEEIDE